jgi:hypothetical protein
MSLELLLLKNDLKESMLQSRYQALQTYAAFQNCDVLKTERTACSR